MSMPEEMQNRARLVLGAWDLPAQEPQLLKYRENAVFRVRLGNGAAAALRLHRPGYHSEPALRSELQLMTALKQGGLAVPEPIATREGDFLVEAVDGQFADLIGWVHGSQIGESGTPLERSRDEIVAIYHGVGVAMADMHGIADAWAAPEGFARSAWDTEGLLGDAPLWGQFWDCPGLESEDRDFLIGLRARLQARLAAIDGVPGGPARVRREHGTVAMIDFDDCGYGWRLFDIATALLRNRREPHYAALRQALIDGYRTRRRLEDAELAHLPLFLLLRSLTYIGWAGARPELPDSAERLARYVRDARDLAGDLH